MPPKSPRLINILAGIIAVAILVALLSPLFLPPGCPNRPMMCAQNLRRLYQLGAIHATSHKGHWPDATGSSLWLSFATTSPPLIQQEDLYVLLCPVHGEGQPGECDYLGPRKPFSQLKPGDALAADRPGNHGEDRGGNVLLWDGSVVEYEYSHPIWKTLAP